MSFDYRKYNLKEHFDEFNQRYWNGELPSGPLCWIKDAKDMTPGAHAQFDFNKSEPQHCWRIKILIPSATSEDSVNELLLHEMIHLQLTGEPAEQLDNPNFHSEKFRARAAQLEKMTGYSNIKDTGVVVERFLSWVKEHNRTILTGGRDTD
jgi:hypothetical protein